MKDELMQLNKYVDLLAQMSVARGEDAETREPLHLIYIKLNEIIEKL